VAGVVTAVLTGTYYTTFRLLESLAVKIHYRPLATVAGILLGWATPPDYPGAVRPALHPAGPAASPLR
jgi:hypothetical protein